MRVRGYGGDDLAAHGLDSPSAKVTLRTTRGTFTLLFGAEHPSLPYVYAAVNDQIVLCDRELRDMFSRVTVDRLRDETICAINSYRAERVLIVGRAHRLELTRKDGPWMVVADYASEAEVGEVRQLVDVLNSWAIDEYVADDIDVTAPGQRYGFDRPRYEIQIFDGAGGREGILIGETGPPDPDGNERVYVAWKGGRNVFLASADVLSLLARPVEHYRSRNLFGLPDPEIRELMVGSSPDRGIHRFITVTREEAPRGEVAWMCEVDDGTRFPADGNWLTDLTELIRNAHLSEFLPRDPDPSRYGLDQPTLQIEITPLEGESQLLKVGSRVPDRPRERFVFRRGWPFLATAVIPAEEVFAKIPWSFRSERVHSIRLDQLTVFRLSRRGSPSITFVRPYQNWVVKGREDLELDKQTVDTVAGALIGLRALRWEPQNEDAPGPDDYDLAIALVPEGHPEIRYWVSDPLGRERVVTENEGPWTFVCRLDDTAPVDPFLLMTHLLQSVE